MSRCIALAFSSVEAAKLLISCIFCRSARMPSSSGNDVPGVGDEALWSTSSPRGCEVFALTAMLKVFLLFSLPLSLGYVRGSRVECRVEPCLRAGSDGFSPQSTSVALGGREVKVQSQVSTLGAGEYVYIFDVHQVCKSHDRARSSPRLWKGFQTSRWPLVVVIRFPPPFHHCFSCESLHVIAKRHRQPCLKHLLNSLYFL